MAALLRARCLNVILFFVIFSVAFAFAQPALSQTIVLNTANDPPNSTDDHTGICERVMTEAFRRIGIKLKIVDLPSERALINANEGIEDGNFARVEGLEKLYPNLIRISETITTFEFVAFSKKASFKTLGWDSLRPYNIGIITGWKILENNIAGVKSLTKVRDEKLLFNLLLSEKADVVVYDRMQGKFVLKQLGAKDIKILQPPLAVKGMYPYLHKRHADLVPKLEQVLRTMKKDGTFKKIVGEVLSDLSLRE
ncbi:MAG: transporter substrate-binding domain-containing protein [Nitrospirae bacterium]|nr:transporter substrate-binding domain-containing protein [Nitrospirota bacterium]